MMIFSLLNHHAPFSRFTQSFFTISSAMRSCQYQLYYHRRIFLDPDVLRKFKIARARRSLGLEMFFDRTIEMSDTMSARASFEFDWLFIFFAVRRLMNFWKFYLKRKMAIPYSGEPISRYG